MLLISGFLEGFGRADGTPFRNSASFRNGPLPFDGGVLRFSTARQVPKRAPIFLVAVRAGAKGEWTATRPPNTVLMPALPAQTREPPPFFLSHYIPSGPGKSRFLGAHG
jgi:hypothetical protein